MSSDVDLVIVEDEREAAAAVADRLAAAARTGGNVVVTGGTSPKLAYREAAARMPDWDGVDVWWSDERCVPPDDELSNYRLVKENLFDLLTGAPHGIHRIKGELGKDEAAAEYEDELGDTVLDLALLGMGKDGHIASLFPNAPTLDEQARVLPAEPGLEPFVDRVTLSIATLRDVRELLFLVTGADKANAVKRAFAEEPSPRTPAGLVRSAHGPTTVVLDRAAAAALPS
jgi:6-phosphogluconolactonase